jgi:hypothetical protein
MAFTVDYWYRHESDTDRSVRLHPQMMAGAETSGDIHKTIAGLRSGGYEVQRVKVHTVCPKCKSNGRYVVKVFKRQPAKYADCVLCGQTGYVGSLDYPVTE